MKRLSIVILLAAAFTAHAAERFISTTGSIEREVPADRLAMTLRLSADEQTLEESNVKLERMMEELRTQIVALNYSSNALSLRQRLARRATKYDDKEKEWVPAGFTSSADYSVKLIGLTNYGRFLTFVGTREGYQVLWSSTSSSLEGEARRQGITEALRAARVKAELLANEGGARLGPLLEVVEENIETREFSGSTWSGNARDPNEGTGTYPIGIFIRVRAKFELLPKQ
jgi:uncharacterized protein YggE